ncbi:MAG: type II toxin-antitoxin system Phd/YefM family antitoxin [Roseimicrobium sp.]
MSVATLQQIGQDLSAWVALVQKGERVAITQAGRVVAQLVPPEPQTEATPPQQAPAWPDFAARRRAIFGGRTLSAGTAQALVDEDRGA